jgi:hypothetical protein
VDILKRHIESVRNVLITIVINVRPGIMFALIVFQVTFFSELPANPLVLLITLRMIQFGNAYLVRTPTASTVQILI